MVEIKKDEKINGVGLLYVNNIVKNGDGIMMKICFMFFLAHIHELREEFIIK